MSVSIQHKAASSISSFDSSYSDSDDENSLKVHPEESMKSIREKTLTEIVNGIKALQDEIEREIKKLSKHLDLLVE